MLIFPIFATIVWALAMYWRRQWPSFAVVTVALAGIWLIVRLFSGAGDLLPAHMYLFNELMWPYLILTGGLGYYICCLPRPPGDLQCRKCRYDLSGLTLRDLSCPECGQQWRGKGSGFEPPPEVLTPIPTAPPIKRRVM